MKKNSTFYNKETLSKIRAAVKNNDSVGKIADKYISDTKYWMNLDYEELKGLVFPPSMKRSWFVLSDGKCPSCGKSVPMYNWLHNPFDTPWKMQCPHCKTLFPSNDFKKFYESGLDSEGVFQRTNADESLLKAPDGGGFAVDDGSGWVDEKGRRYLFIAAYLAHSHWMRLIYGGILKLAFCHVLTGEGEYARRAAILLHATAIHFPDYDFKTQGVMYEKENNSEGYVTYWANACNELRMMALAYDQVFDFISKDASFGELTKKPPLQAAGFIEDRIFKDALINPHKIDSNPPNKEVTLAVIKSVLDSDLYKKEIMDDIDGIIRQSTKVDGLSGEKGLSAYTAIAPRVIADLLCLYTNTDPDFIPKIVKRHPVLYKTYRFHINTWYDSKYYPGIGDSAVFAIPIKRYTALFAPFSDVDTFHIRSRAWFAMKLCECTGDPDFAKAAYISNGRSTKGLFDKDIYIEETSQFETRLSNIIRENGSEMKQETTNYDKWRLSILHAGSDDDKYMLAMPYDSGANHCHHDALSLHLFGKGLYLTPDFGYVPVNYGGWETKEVDWYRHPASHNMVVIDGCAHTNLPNGKFYRYPEYGENLMLVSSSFVNATYNDSRHYAGVSRYERMSALINISEEAVYCVDISRTLGGYEHSRFFRTSYSDISTEGLNPAAGRSYYPDRTIMRDFRTDDSPSSGWNVDFAIEDFHKTACPDKIIHVKYHGLTPESQLALCESWVDITRMQRISGETPGDKVVWIPTLIETLPGPKTQFTGIIDIYDESPSIESYEKLDLSGTGGFLEALEVKTANGFRDIIILNDPTQPGTVSLKEYKITTDALFTVMRYLGSELHKAVLFGGTFMKTEKDCHTKGEKNGKVEFL